MRIFVGKLTPALILFGLCVAGCTRENVAYSDGNTEVPQGSTAGEGTGDGSGSAMVPELPRDCEDGARRCVGTRTEVCIAGKFATERECPDACTGEHCDAPDGVDATAIGDVCDGGGGALEALCRPFSFGEPSCQPFVTGGMVRWYCGAPVGKKGAGIRCKENSECRSGICVASTNQCLQACRSNVDCPPPVGGHGFACRSVAITVEGATTNALSCVLD